MRVLQVHAQYRQPGGEDAVVSAERGWLEGAGHVVHQCIAENPRTRRGAALAFASSGWNPAAARRVGEATERFRPDVAHVHNTWFAHSPSVLFALRRRGVPVVMTVHNYRLVCGNGLLLRDGAPCEACIGHHTVPAVRNACYRDSHIASTVAAAGIAAHSALGTWTRGVDRYLVLTRFASDRLQRAGLPSARMALAPNAVADPGPRSLPAARSRDVLFVGRLSPEKGVAVLLEAWRRTEPEGLRLLIVGDGPARGALERSAPRNVDFLGRLCAGDVRQLLLRARALVIPSIWYEGQPLVALEGLAAGLPLLMSNIGGLPEILNGGRAGWLSAPGDAAALAGALVQLRSDTAVADRGLEARCRYEEAFTPDLATRRLEHTYAELAACGRG